MSLSFWQDLPQLFKRSVVGSLDYKTRCRLRRCSVSDKELVDSCPLFLNYVEIGIAPNQTAHLAIDDGNGGYLVHTKNNPIPRESDTITDFLSIFKHPKSQVNRLYFANYEPEQSDVEAVVKKLTEKLSAIQNLKLKTREFRWILPNTTGNQFLEILHFLAPKSIQTIEILYSFPPEIMEKIYETAQWKLTNLKEITVYGKYDFTSKIHNFCGDNVVSLILSCEKYTPDDVITVIKSWQTKPLKSLFILYSITVFNNAEILKKFENPKHEPFMDSDKYVHVQKFPVLNNADLVLIVKLDSRMATGKVCRRNFLREDFESSN